MIDIHELASGSLSCPISHMASILFSPSSSPSSPYDTPKCSLLDLSQFPSASPFLSPSSSSSSFSFRQEPLLFCNFDLNPNTSTFTLTFLTALILQLTGFFLIKRYLPQVANPQTNRQNRRALSWILSLFSSIILFTGTFTLSSEIEWNLPGNALSLERDGRERTSPFFLMASMHRFPHESGLATAYCAYFVSYLICDLGLGMVYYRDFVDPLSGWAHHLFYLGVMSRATAQGNISTLFAMGTPIEVSTIFLAMGHIFPTLRSDVIFATSFFLARIVYPIILLPELILNVESRLCWKVGAMALLVHVYWFYKFVQQQLRYYHTRQEQKQTSVLADVKTDEQSATTTVTHKSEEEESLKIQTQSEDLKKAGIVYEYDVTVAVPAGKSAEVKTPESPVAANEMFGTGLSAIPLIQVNSNRHRRPRVVRLPSGHSIASLASFETLADKDGAATPAVTITSPPAITAPTTTIAAATATATTSSVTTKGAKTMKELLEECSDEDISTYKFPIHSNKTLSALARKPSNGSQGLSSNGDLGVVRLSRASSMRDSKRRIALGAIQFACPSSSSSAAVSEPKARKMEDEPNIKNVEVVEEKEEEETMKKKDSNKKTNSNNMDADATVVMRPRRSSPSRDGDYGFGTVRVSSRGGVVAVNA